MQTVPLPRVSAGQTAGAAASASVVGRVRNTLHTKRGVDAIFRRRLEYGHSEPTN